MIMVKFNGLTLIYKSISNEKNVGFKLEAIDPEVANIKNLDDDKVYGPLER